MQGAVTPAERSGQTELPVSPLVPLAPPPACRGVQSEAEAWLRLSLRSWPCLEARTDWAQERGFSTTEQIPPLIRNAQGRKNLGQSATVWIWLIIFLWFLEEPCQSFLQLHTASRIFILYLNNINNKNLLTNNNKKKCDQG